MKQIVTNQSQEEYLRILGKGMVTIPKEWRVELGLDEGDVVKAKKMGNKVVIELPEGEVPYKRSLQGQSPYRTFSDQEIEAWVEADKLPRALVKKIDQKLKSLR